MTTAGRDADIDASPREGRGLFSLMRATARAALDYALPPRCPGCGTVTQADHLFCVVPAASKAEAVKGAVFGPVSEKCPASILRRHKSAILYTDKDSTKYIMD